MAIAFAIATSFGGNVAFTTVMVLVHGRRHKCKPT